MNTDEIPAKLRLAPPEPPEQLALRCEREQRAKDLQRETNLGASLAPFHVGSVNFLNAVPLTRGLEEQVAYATPSELAAQLRRDELDAALVSVTEVLFTDRYDVLNGIAIASLGEVKSVFLAHRAPVDAAKEIYYDPASQASVYLLRVLLAERGLRPEFKPLPDYDAAALADYALLIGDRALDYLLGPHRHEIWDLGTAWYELTGLPFVYAVWAMRRTLDTSLLRRQLRAAKDFGLDTLDYIISSRTDYNYDFRKDYLSWHIHYHMGADEKRGLARFMDLLEQHGFGPVFQPRFIE
jgi:chorismate dehydratase